MTLTDAKAETVETAVGVGVGAGMGMGMGMGVVAGEQDDGALHRSIRSRRARLAVLGLGHVGLPTAVAFAENGFEVVGIDRDPQRVRDVAGGRSPILDIADGRVRRLRAEGRLHATEDERVLADVDVALVCVPTPLSPSRRPDLGPLHEAFGAIARWFRPRASASKTDTDTERGRLVVVESTTYPGATREHLVSALAAVGAEPGHDVHVAFSPERIDPGNGEFPLDRVPKVVGGLTPRCASLASLLYEKIVRRVVLVSSLEAAEMTKLLENTFRSVNIALINEWAAGCRTLGLDPWEIVDAASTKPYGFLPFWPGPGVGGHCVPVDPLWLAERLRSSGAPTRFIELADEVHANTTEGVVQRICEALGAADGSALPLRGRRVLLSGIAYKRDVDDARESPALVIRARLVAQGASVDYHDPWVPSVPELELRSLSEPISYGDYEVVIVLADHTRIDYPRMLVEAKLIIDTRNVLSRFVGRSGAQVKARIIRW